MAIRNADAASCQVACQPTSGAASPADLLPFLIGQHRIGRDRRPVRDVRLTAPARLRDGEDQGNIGRRDGLASRKPYGPQQAALHQSLAERAA
jgi:hypothetical protein